MEENCTIIDNEILLIWLTVSTILILATIIHIFIRNMIIKPIEEIALDLSLGNSIGMLVYIYIYYREKCRNCKYRLKYGLCAQLKFYTITTTMVIIFSLVGTSLPL